MDRRDFLKTCGLLVPGSMLIDPSLNLVRGETPSLMSDAEWSLKCIKAKITNSGAMKFSIHSSKRPNVFYQWILNHSRSPSFQAFFVCLEMIPKFPSIDDYRVDADSDGCDLFIASLATMASPAIDVMICDHFHDSRHDREVVPLNPDFRKMHVVPFSSIL